MDPDGLTLGAALRLAAARAPDRPALVHASGTRTWQDLDAEVDRAAAVLADLGLERGQTLGICTSKRPEVVVAFLAAARLGARVAPVNFKHRPPRVAAQLAVGQVRALLLEARLDEAPSLGMERIGAQVLYLGEAGRYSHRTWAEVEGATPVPLPRVRPEEPAYLNFTSGTTGEPKAAVQTHAHILHNARSTVEGLGFTEDDVFMGMFSVFSHPHEIFHRSLWVAGTAVVVDTLSPRIAALAVAEHGVTWMMAVPSFYELMAAHLGRDRYELSSLRVLEAGGAWVPPDARQRVEAALGGTFLPVWGSTEAAGAALALGPEHRTLDATGRALPGYEARVCSEDGEAAPDGTTGELWLRGPAVSDTYLGDPEATARAFPGGWYRTGDWFHRDQAGLLHFEGRRSEMMKVGGIRVFPLEIERVLLASPAIAEAVVVSARERLRGEVPRAVVRPVAGELTVDEVKRWCREHLPDYAVPRIVEIRDTIPKLPNGKIDRRAVSEERA